MKDKMSLDRIDFMMREVFSQLKTMGGRGRGKEVLAAIEPRLGLSEYERETTKTGAVRWDTHIRFYTTDCVKAGYLQKDAGMWTLTPSGEEALGLPKGELIRSANRAYRIKHKAEEDDDSTGDAELQVREVEAERQATYEQAKETSRAEIERYLDEMDEYDFQRLVAELLAAMGYHVRHIAPPGPDGGVDIHAYRDPLGTVEPRILVQVKHRQQKVSVAEVRELEGLLRRDGEIGLIVSSGGITAEGEREIRSSHRHIDTMDQDRLIELWQEHYEKVAQTGKALLPLVQVFFLAPSDITT